MTTAALARRRARTHWSPRRISGAVAWWSADDVAGSNGASISSWTDRLAGLAVTQATGSKQPTLVTNSGSTGHQALRFTAANLQVLSGSRGSIPDAGPFFVWVVHKPVSFPAAGCVTFEVATPAVTNKGWAHHYGVTGNLNLPTVTLWGVVDLSQASGGDGTGVVQWREAAHDPITAHQLRQSWNNVGKIDLGASSSNANSGSTSIAIGGSLGRANYWLDSEVLQIIVGTGVPSDADRAFFAAWLFKQFGIYCGKGYNASAAATIAGKNHDGTASSGTPEIGVIYNAAGIFGHKYWMGFAPYTSGAPDENPNVAFSDDGNTWSSTGISNPIVAYPGGGSAGNNADPSLLDNVSRDGYLYLYFVRENATTTATNGVYYTRSNDGTTWSAAAQVLASTGSNFYEVPGVAYDAASAKYWLYTVDLTTGTMYRQTSSTPTGPWSAQVACTVTVPNGRSLWHQSPPVLVNGKWVFGFSDGQAGQSPNLWIASSLDGLTWETSRRPLAIPGHGTAWDVQGVYRPALADAGDGANLKLWYVFLAPGAPPFSSGLGQMVTVPITEIP